jgi:hypothetical protein
MQLGSCRDRCGTRSWVCAETAAGALALAAAMIAMRSPLPSPAASAAAWHTVLSLLSDLAKLIACLLLLQPGAAA